MAQVYATLEESQTQLSELKLANEEQTEQLRTALLYTNDLTE